MSRALRRAGYVLCSDEWLEKIVSEGVILSALGLLDDFGSVWCPECDEEVFRAEGWSMRFECSCGWKIEDVPV